MSKTVSPEIAKAARVLAKPLAPALIREHIQAMGQDRIEEALRGSVEQTGSEFMDLVDEVHRLIKNAKISVSA